MYGHVLWLNGYYFKVINEILEKINSDNIISLQEIKKSLSPVILQAKFEEQLKIIRKMKENGISDQKICNIFGYDRYFLDELLSLDKDFIYDYSQFKYLNF